MCVIYQWAADRLAQNLQYHDQGQEAGFLIVTLILLSTWLNLLKFHITTYHKGYWIGGLYFWLVNVKHKRFPTCRLSRTNCAHSVIIDYTQWNRSRLCIVSKYIRGVCALDKIGLSFKTVCVHPRICRHITRRPVLPILPYIWITQRQKISVSNVRYFHYYPVCSPGQNGRHFTDDILKYIFLNEKYCNLIRISMKFVPKGPIDNKWALFQVMDWRRTGDKPLSETMLTQYTDAYMRH